MNRRENGAVDFIRRKGIYQYICIFLFKLRILIEIFSDCQSDIYDYL